MFTNPNNNFHSISEQEQSAIKSIAQSQDQFPVDFDDTVSWLGYSTKANARRMLSDHFEKDLDFSSEMMKTPNGGRPSERIYLTIDCFKQLCMMAGTDRGKEVRKYFIQCEKELKSIKAQPQLPGDYLSALKALVASEEEKLVLTAANAELESKVVEMQPKAEIYDIVISSGKNLTIGEVAKLIGIPGLGRNKMFDLLRAEGILMGGNLPYQQFINQGFFVVVQKPRAYNTALLDDVSLVTQKGLQFIINRLKAKGYNIPSAA